MSAREDVLRALVYSAFEVRGTPAMRGACDRIVTVHAIWPAIEYARAIERAESELEKQRLEEERELLAWYASIPCLNINIETEAARAA